MGSKEKEEIKKEKKNPQKSGNFVKPLKFMWASKLANFYSV